MIYVVGIGPGAVEDMTVRAYKTIQMCDVIVGYTKYVRNISSLTGGKEIIFTGMKGEVDRCKKAIMKGLQGKKVALVSSGDAGVYGMAGLVMELAAAYPALQIQVVPGVTAAISAGALLGAPLMNDFAVISLSDLLTKWQVVEKRIVGAGMGDLTIVLYNPGSKTRRDAVKKVVQLLLPYRTGGVLCGVCRNISREKEETIFCTLDQLQEMVLDMSATVVIGNSQTTLINGKMVSPRGYNYG